MDATMRSHEGAHVQESRASAGMKAMVVLMGLCVLGTSLAGLAPAIGAGPAAPLAVVIGAGFAWLSLVRMEWMGALMGLCCGAGVLVTAAPETGVAALLVAVPVGLVIGVGCDRLMRRAHAHTAHA